MSQHNEVHEFTEFMGVLKRLMEVNRDLKIIAGLLRL
jgi:hypothetical protein